MPKTTYSRIKSKPQNVTKKTSETTNFFDSFKFGESYTSLILGIIVVIVATVLLLTFVRGRADNPEINTENFQQQIVIDNKAEQEIDSIKLEATRLPEVALVEQKNKTTNTSISASQGKITGDSYTVASGDNLWSIAERKYNNGFNWIEIKNANKLENPDILPMGKKLILPKITAKTNVDIDQNKGSIASGESIKAPEKIDGNYYTVVKGDTLWDISVRVYGDGYQWSKIASANKLLNPDLIHPGNKFIIPR